MPHKDIGFVAQNTKSLKFLASFGGCGEYTRYLTLADVWQTYGDAQDDIRGCDDADQLRVIPVKMKADKVS